MEEVSLIITKAEQVVRDAHHQYDRVNDEFKKWKNDQSDYSVKHPEYQEWLEHLEKVEKPLNEAYQHLNKERAMAEKANQSNVGPTVKSNKLQQLKNQN